MESFGLFFVWKQIHEPMDLFEGERVPIQIRLPRSSPNPLSLKVSHNAVTITCTSQTTIVTQRLLLPSMNDNPASTKPALASTS